MGLFTKKPIPKGTTIMKVEEESKMNDGAINLEPILRATSSVATYEAWTNIKKTYYDLEKIKRVANVRMVIDPTVNSFYEALQDIPADGELIRVYGFTTWILELLDILTDKNIVGFIRFIDELIQDIDGDPYENKARQLQKALHQYQTLNPNATLNCKEYDEKMVNEKVNYVGHIIKGLYLMSS